MKRALDVAVAVAALVLLSPVLAAVALAVRLTMGRPVLFRQVRPGLHGEPFVLGKFRTMRPPARPGAELEDPDARLTRLGRFLRATSLDELPELVNVLKGDMSLVGPRPLLVEYLPLYTAEQARRHLVRPGITGLAQINGRNALDWDRRFSLDVYYVDHASLWLDLKILALTVPSVFRREGVTAAGGGTAPLFSGTQPAAHQPASAHQPALAHRTASARRRGRTMRIVYIHQYYSNLQMPGGTRSFELARRLVSRGHQVDVITTERSPTRRGLGWRQSNDDGIDVHWFGVPYSNHMSYARRMRAFAEFAVAATAKATRLRADVVLATSTPLTVAIPGVVASRLRRVPFVFEVRDLWPEIPIDMGALRNPVAKRLAGSLASFAYRNAEHVVALSPGMAAGVTARYAPARTTVIPNASDLELFADRGEAAQRFRAEHDWLGDRPLVVYTGTVGPANGVAYLVRLAALVRTTDPEVRFLILGHGKEWEQARQLAVDLGVLDETLRMWPEVPKAEIPVILSAATMATSVFLPLPSLRDNSANKFFDALAAGRPIAINYGGWQRDLLLDSEAGIVLDYDDHDAAATALLAHLHDREWLSLAGKAAHRLAVEQFSRDMRFDRFESLLAAAAAAHGHGHGHGQHRSPDGRRRRPARAAVTIDGGTRSGTP